MRVRSSTPFPRQGRGSIGILIAALALLASGCAPAPTPAGPQGAPGAQPQTASSPSGRPLHAGMATEPTVIGSKFGGGGSGATDFPFVFHAQLTQFDPNGVPVPILAQEAPSVEQGSWRLFDDGRMETTYRLRPNLTWHDGTPFTSEDVVFTWRAIMNPALPALDRQPEKYIDDVEASDPQTILVRWGRPYIYANVWDLQPIPRHILGPLVTDPHAFGNATYWTTGWVGLGPYRLTEWAPGSHVRGEAFLNFALGAPRIRSVIVHIVPDANQAVAQMLAGVIDVTLGSLIRPDEGVIIKEQLEPRREASLVTIPTKMRHGVFQFRDPSIPWVRDARVRQAMMHALDRQAMADLLMQGYSRISDMYIAPNDPVFPLADRAITKYPYDPGRATQLLGQAGWTTAGDGRAAGRGGHRIQGIHPRHRDTPHRQHHAYHQRSRVGHVKA